MDATPSLFDLPPATRRTDPVTSRMAEQQHALDRQTHCRIVLDVIRKHPGLTSAEIASTARLERHEAARRCADLERKGLVSKGARRACSVKGSWMVTWQPKE